MDKRQFIEEAPIFYALAIAAELERTSGSVSERTLEKRYTFQDETFQDQYGNSEFSLIDNIFLWGRAMEWLESRNMISTTKASFGPYLYSKSSHFGDEWAKLITDEPIFEMYSSTDDKHDWLTSALHEIRNAYVNLGLTNLDFESSTDEWEPIELDTSQPAYHQAVTKLDEVVADIRAHNGYSASYPEERDFVVDSLEGTVEKLKKGSITAGYIRDAWEKLSIVGRRFRGAGLELVTLGVKQAIVDFVKQQGGDLLRMLTKLFSGF